VKQITSASALLARTVGLSVRCHWRMDGPMELKTTALKTYATDLRQVRSVGSAAGVQISQPRRDVSTNGHAALDSPLPVAPVIARQGAKPEQHQEGNAPFIDYLMVNSQGVSGASPAAGAGAGASVQVSNDTFTANVALQATGYQAGGKPGRTLSDQEFTGLVMDIKV